MGLSRFSVKEPQLTDLNNGYYQLEEGFRYETNKKPDFESIGKYFIKVKPFVTDLSSHPWWSRWLIPRRGNYDLPSIVHDFLIQSDLYESFPRWWKDAVYVEALEDAGVKRWRCWLMYRAVRLYAIYKEWKNAKRTS